MNTKKINAFTLSEMLVVLVVSSILISMAFVVVSMVQKQVYLIQKNLSKKQQLLFFEATLLRDFNTHRVFFIKEENSLLLKSGKDSISYTFFDDFVIRGTDTIKISFENKTLFLDGAMVTDGEIDAIALNLLSSYANAQLFLQKTKGATFYLNK
jgi:prepilin-type N-terminal cleavage/methylation domain-containing protein